MSGRDDSFVIAPEAVGESVQSGQVIGMDGVCPCGEMVSREVADHPCEGMYVSAGGGQLGASGEDFAKLLFFVGAEMLGVPHDPLATCCGLSTGAGERIEPRPVRSGRR